MRTYDALKSLPALRFLLHFDKLGGANFGATGMSEAVTIALDRAQLVMVTDYKPMNRNVSTPRRYRRVYRGENTGRFAELFRFELRARNLATIDGLDDGHGRVAFNADWKTRRTEIIAAAATAWGRTIDS